LTSSRKVKQIFLCNFNKSLKAIEKRIEDATYSEIYKEILLSILKNVMHVPGKHIKNRKKRE